MASIKIDDLPKDRKISKDEMRKVLGGIIISNNMPSPFVKSNLKLGGSWGSRFLIDDN